MDCATIQLLMILRGNPMLAFLLTVTDEAYHPQIKYLFDSYHKDMIIFARSMLKKHNIKNYKIDAEDAVQSAFLKISKFIHYIDFSRSKQDVKNYIFTILINEINEILENYKKISKKYEKIEEFSFEDPYNYIDELDIKERYDEVLSAMDNLDEKYSSVLYLAYVEEKTPNEIAELMGIPVKTVYTRIARGKQNLIKSVKGE